MVECCMQDAVIDGNVKNIDAYSKDKEIECKVNP